MLLYKYLVSPLLLKIAEKIASEYMGGLLYLNDKLIERTLRELKKYKFKIGKFRCIRKNKMSFDIFLQRWVVWYTCMKNTKRNFRRVALDALYEEELVEALNGNSKLEGLLEPQPAVFIPRPDTFVRIWTNADLLEGTVKATSFRVRAVWGFTDSEFVNNVAVSPKTVKGAMQSIMVTYVDGVPAVYNVLPKYWYMCMPIRMKVIRGPDRGEEVDACITITNTTVFDMISKEFSIGKIFNVKKEKAGKDSDLEKELRELIMKEVLNLEREQLQGLDILTLLGVSGESTDTEERRGLERFLRRPSKQFE